MVSHHAHCRSVYRYIVQCIIHNRYLVGTMSGTCGITADTQVSNLAPVGIMAGCKVSGIMVGYKVSGIMVGYKVIAAAEITMLQERALDEVVSPFLMQLSKARLLFLKLDEDSSFLEIKHLFQNIEKEAYEVENILQRVSRWENEIIDDLGGIARYLDDIVEEESHLNSICLKLQIVNAEMSNLKDRMKLPLHVPVIKPSVPPLLPASSPAKLLPANLSKQIKYLCLRGISRITALPASIGELSNLMILDLHACHNLERLTESITSLQMLTHLDVSECYLLEGMPRGIGLLTELQVLKGFVIGGSTSNYNCRVAELVRLEKLNKLSVYIGSKVAVTGDELNELENIKGLGSLTITWAVSVLAKGNYQQASVATAMLTSLSLPPNLQKLDLRCFPGKKIPSWLSPSKLLGLKKLYFTGGMLNTFGDGSMSEMWKVEILRLKFLNDLEVEWTQLHETFPNLTFLEVFRCSKLESFPCDKDGVWMNCDKQKVR
uniref:Disease resistance R13L4/SHOC-2-like LRR domain-containing protein n=1 Tax=Oryza meridionalis TaxID=40149 RepID=A0A0E0C8U9_9ORYZ